MSDTRTDNNNYINPLAPAQRGKFYIGKSDPNNTAIGLAKLGALFGAGNVIVVDDQELLKYLSTDLLSLYSAEGFDPLALSSTDSSTSGITNQISGTVTLTPPTNLKIGTSKLNTASGSNTISVTVLFNPVPGADFYEIKYVASQAKSTLPVTNVVTSDSTSGNIVVAWDAIANATNYVMAATNQSTNASSSELIVPTSGDTRVSGSFTNVPHGTYKVTITPYNQDGLAGAVFTTGNITV
jgi:hypothetical protein